MCCPWVKYMPLRLDGPQASNHQPGVDEETQCYLNTGWGCMSPKKLKVKALMKSPGSLTLSLVKVEIFPWPLPLVRGNASDTISLLSAQCVTVTGLAGMPVPVAEHVLYLLLFKAKSAYEWAPVEHQSAGRHGKLLLCSHFKISLKCICYLETEMCLDPVYRVSLLSFFSLS